MLVVLLDSSLSKGERLRLTGFASSLTMSGLCFAVLVIDQPDVTLLFSMLAMYHPRTWRVWQAEETAAAAYNAVAPLMAQVRLMPVARSTPNLLAAAAAGAAGTAKTVSQPVVSNFH